MLDQDRTFTHFKTMSGLGEEEAGGLRPFCDAAAGQVGGRLRPGVDLGRNMDRLCIAAATLAYCDWLEFGGALSTAEEIRVGDITLRERSGASARRGGELRRRCLEGIADLLEPVPALFTLREGPS